MKRSHYVVIDFRITSTDGIHPFVLFQNVFYTIWTAIYKAALKAKHGLTERLICFLK
jgi:hypothetical protein